MKHAEPTSDRSSRTTRAEEAGVGQQASTVAPPAYGIDVIDSATRGPGATGIAMARGGDEPRAAPTNDGPGRGRAGLPGRLRAGIEQLSGVDMSAVTVEYASSRPAQIRALAYARGTEIHLGPGQERHLPHEAWHVVQQIQGRVAPRLQAKGLRINGDSELEREADVMGARAALLGESSASVPESADRPGAPAHPRGEAVIQPLADPELAPFLEYVDRKVAGLRDVSDIQRLLLKQKALEVGTAAQTPQAALTAWEQALREELGAGAFTKWRLHDRLGSLARVDIEDELLALQGGGIRGSLVTAAGAIPGEDERAIAKHSIAMFNYLDRNAATVDAAVQEAFQDIPADDVPGRDQFLQDLSTVMYPKLGDRGLWAGDEDRVPIFTGEKTAATYFREGKATLEQRGAQAVQLSGFLRAWSLGLEAKTYGRRLASLKLTSLDERLPVIEVQAPLVKTVPAVGSTIPILTMQVPTVFAGVSRADMMGLFQKNADTVSALKARTLVASGSPHITYTLTGNYRLVQSLGGNCEFIRES